MDKERFVEKAEFYRMQGHTYLFILLAMVSNWGFVQAGGNWMQVPLVVLILGMYVYNFHSMLKSRKDSAEK